MRRVLRIHGPAPALHGRVRPPSDKSITHRALILGALCVDESTIRSPLRSADIAATERCLAALGASIEVDGEVLRVRGPLLREVADSPILDCGDSGTSARLLLGLVAGLGVPARLEGSPSLCRRPMGRVLRPLMKMGARFGASSDVRLPLDVDRGSALIGCSHVLEVASAQLKSALLLAGLFADGETTVTEPLYSRDHTERMLPVFGVPVHRSGLSASLMGGQSPVAAHVTVPADLSSALYAGIAALLVPDSQITVEESGVNPTRTGALEVLEAMGASLELANQCDVAGEPRADLTFRSEDLHAVDVSEELFPRLLDDVPVLAVAAARATAGKTVFRGVQELRVKESDRVASTADMLRAFGGRVEETADTLVVHGGVKLRPGRVDPVGDHRIALAAATMALSLEGESRIDGFDCIDQSFPDYLDCMSALLGGRTHEVFAVTSA